MIEFSGPPSRWVVRGGKPADCLGDVRDRIGGMPSYEHEDQGGLAVFDFMLLLPTSQGGLMMISKWYGMAVLIAPEEVVPLHHSPGAWWVWRPMLWRRNVFGGFDCLGSQEELGWRYGLQQVELAKASIEGDDYDIDFDFSMSRADAKARELLLEHLTPQQRIEYASTKGSSFCCRGGKTKNLYRVRVGNGFEILSKLTRETAVSYCLHPEYWMPHDDVALAVKLQLEDPELEEDVLANGKSTMLDGPRVRSGPSDRIAARMEAELI